VQRTSLLILGHGSRRARANAEFQALVAAFRARHPFLDVAHAYIELAAPLLDDALAATAARADRVLVLPLFLFAAGHVKDDLPEALARARAAFPRVRFAAARALGVHGAMADAALARIAGALPMLSPETAGTTLVVVGRGASDADANGDFCKMVRLLGEAGGFARAEPSFIAVTHPRFEVAAERALAAGSASILVLPYLLFDGLLVEQLRDEVSELGRRHPRAEVRLARPLGIHPRLLDLLDERLEDALAGRAVLPCDGCPRTVAA
jgi:sirohydrochlorin cobaltochelatase